MEIWAIVAGDEVKDIDFIRGNLLKRTKQIKKDIPSWVEKPQIVRLDITSDSEVLLNFAIDCVLRGI